MRNFCTPHSHPSSFDSGTTQLSMVKRELELGTSHGTITDHGTMGGCLDWYELCRKHGVLPILGIEAFFRDDNCPILNEFGLIQPLINSKDEILQLKSAAGYQKYFHLTLHALDQEAYETIVRLHSKASLTNREHHGSEWKPLFTWKDLEELGSKNITVGSSCLVGMVGRHLMAGKPELAERYYLKLKNTVKPGNFYVELFPHDCSCNWENKVSIVLEDQSEIKLKEDRKVLINGERIKLKDFMRRKVVPDKFTLDGTFYYSDLTEVGKKIVSVELKRGFFKNECTVYSPDGDLQKSMNKFMIEMATKHGDPIMISDDAHYAHPKEKLVQDARLGNGKDDWKFWGNYHRMSSDEAATHFYKTLGVTDTEIERWIDNGYEWASRFDSFSLKFDIQLPTRFYEQHGDLLTHVRKLIAKHGRLDVHSPEMISRLVTELNMLTQNGTVNLLPYFLPLEEVVDAYQENNLLTGPGRGSAAGLLLTYLLGITHVNPLRYGLSLERFITEDRIKAGTLPDIDQDLEDRTFLVGENGYSGWLHNRFGSDYVAQISTNTNLRLKSSIKDVHRARGTLTDTVEQICKRLPTPPQGIDDLDFIFGKVDEDGTISKDIPGILDNPALQEYMDKYPEEWSIVQFMIGISRQRSRHACAFIVGSKPIAEFIPMTLIGEVPCTEYTAKSVEKAGGIKTDFLVVNSLKDIRRCLELIRQRHAPDLAEYVTLNAQRVPRVRIFPAPAVPGATGTQLLDVWDLPEDQGVFASICQGETETVFQLNTSGAVQYLKLFTKDEQHLIRSIEDIAAFTALDRPGPLDYEVEPGKNMLHEFVTRKKGFTNRSAHAFSQYLLETLPETHGIMVYQEQVMKVVRELGGFNPMEANNFRICVGKKKQAELMAMRPKFLEGATPKVGAGEAEKLFDMMVTFGQYGFNKSVDQDSILYTEAGRKSIKNVCPGETVYGVDNKGELVPTEVVALHDHGHLPGYEVEFSNGSKVVCSIEHKFLTNGGMIPLWQILEQQYEVLSFEKSTYLDRSVWETIPASSPHEGTSPDLRSMYQDQASQHRGKTNQAQYFTGTAKGVLPGGPKNFCTSGNSSQTSGSAQALERATPQTVCSHNTIGTTGIEKPVKDGGLVATIGHSSLERQADPLRQRPQVSGFCEGPDLGRSRRILPLQPCRIDQRPEAVSTEESTSDRTIQRRHVKGRGTESEECDVDSGRIPMFLGERKNERRMACFTASNVNSSATGRLVPLRIIRVSYVGIRKMYDLEVAHTGHNFILDGGVVTSNSHAVCYSVIAYACAYLKYHYPLEWWCSVLQNADKNEIYSNFWRHCRHLILQPDINKSKGVFVIEGDAIRSPIGLMDGVGPAIRDELVRTAPFKDIRDLLQRVNKRVINRKILLKLLISGVMDSLFQETDLLEERYEQYQQARQDVLGEDKEPLPEQYRGLLPIQLYCIRKDIIPTYVLGKQGNFVQTFLGFAPRTALESQYGAAIAQDEKGVRYMQFRHGRNNYRMVNPTEFERLVTDQSKIASCAFPAYVIEEKRFSYAQGAKEALKLTVDFDGVVVQMVKWPEKDTGRVFLETNQKLEGSVVFLFVNRWKEGRDFSIDDVRWVCGVPKIEETPEET